MEISNKKILKEVVEREVYNVEVTDMHTHLFSNDFKDLLLYGIDELLIYHYLIDEYFRFTNSSYEEFFALSKNEKVNRIWKTLFIDHSPVSEAQRGVLTILSKLGLDVSKRDLEAYREYFDNISPDELIDKVLEIAKVKNLVMTNDPFDDLEKHVWTGEGNEDKRFRAALRLDPLLNHYEGTYKKIIDMGYEVEAEVNEKSVNEIHRFLREWIKKMDAVYVACSMPPSFKLPEDSNRSRIIERCLIPVCRELNVPLALMIGVKRRVNYMMGLAGDSVGKSDIATIEYLCRTYPENKFLVTMLGRENQHELTMTARKFKNLMIFGCWWMLNTPIFIEELTRMRMEFLGLSFVPQHSDCRVFEQLIYKWDHSRKIIAEVLIEKYSDILDSGWKLTEEAIKRDIEDLFVNNFWNFIEK